jgi:hypothetical protein
VTDTRLFCDVAEDIRQVAEAHDAGWAMVPGQVVVPVERVRAWAEAMERASLIIEGPP